MKPLQVTLLALLAALLIGVVDYATGPLFALTLFYLFPVAAVAWYAGRRAGAAFGFLCVGVWFLADLESLGTRDPLWIDLWNGVIRLVFFLLLTELLVVIRRGLDREMAAAREIQTALLPASTPQIAGVEIGVRFWPARNVSGDYYDVISENGGGRFLICIGDVAGKGAGAALLMASVQGSVRALAKDGCPLDEMCGRLNRLLVRAVPLGRFVTFCIARVEIDTGRVTYVNAGHNPPIMLRADGRHEELMSTGLVLGVMPEAEYAESTALLEPGSRLVLFTDGVIEAIDRDGQQFGRERLERLLASCPADSPTGLAERILEETRTFEHGKPQDDTTVVVVGLTGKGEARPGRSEERAGPPTEYRPGISQPAAPDPPGG
jgi:hypothetical protein